MQKNSVILGTYLKLLTKLLLADPSYTENGKIDLILGAVEYAQIIKSGPIKGAPNEPIAQNSELGWIISGPAFNKEPESKINVVALISNVEIVDKLNQIFATDDVKD